MSATAEPRKVRKQREDGLRSRRTILDAAAKLATVEGLEGLSIGRLAEHIGMSKSGLYAHFGSKEELQLATIETAAEIFQEHVIAPTEAIESPRARLEGVTESFLDHLERRVFPGGCFFASAAAEFDTHPGPVKERIAAYSAEFLETLEELADEAQREGELGAGQDPGQVAFEIDAYLLMANTAFLLHNDPKTLDRARAAIQARLGR
ncbi:MAG TPA: helix-turn-helix domain-containing protein [Gaiellaceae bacterium]|nr:helix-turn-helix domain-containing protein [Gaiellaceae bacterium]